jgi:hypothetical protein
LRHKCDRSATKGPGYSFVATAQTFGRKASALFSAYVAYVAYVAMEIGNSLMVLTPTWQNYLAYDGLHCAKLWGQLDDTWKCPGCDRTKFQLLRWARIHYPRGTSRMGWFTALHTHHDHSARDDQPPRFIEQVICDNCNMVDGAVKRRFREMRSDFSFAPVEIRAIITARPHRTHIIHYDGALHLWLTIDEVRITITPRYLIEGE